MGAGRPRDRWFLAAAAVLLVTFLGRREWTRPVVPAGTPAPWIPSGTLAEHLDGLEGADPADSSWPLLMRACHRLVEPLDHVTLYRPVSLPSLALQWWFLEVNRPLLPLLREAGRRRWLGKPHDILEYYAGWCEYLEGTDDQQALDLCRRQWEGARRPSGSQDRRGHAACSDLVEYFQLPFLLVLSARELRAQGRWQEAWSDLEGAFGLCQQLLRRALPSDVMSGASSADAVQREFRALVLAGRSHWTAAEWERLAHGALTRPGRRALDDVMAGGWLRSLIAVDWWFDERRRSPAPRVSLGAFRWEDLLLLLHAGREDTLRALEVRHGYLLSLEEVPPILREDRWEVPEEVLPLGPLGSVRYAHLDRFLPDWEYQDAVANLEWEESQRDASATVVALARFRQARGDWPRRLEDLVPAYRDRLPRDRHTWEPLCYRLEDGAPLLYGRGRDGEDDGGDPKEDEVILPLADRLR